MRHGSHVLTLFDIDGTLVRGGPAKDAFHRAMIDVFSTAGEIELHDFSGKTDPQIARELLVTAGVGEARVKERLPLLWSRYLEELDARLGDCPMETLPGVAELLRELQERPHVHLGLVTGNIAGGARLKLGSAGLGHVAFEVGGFGSDHEERNHLPGIAMERAKARWKVEFNPRDVIVIGDTPRDVECGVHHGTRTLAVATGRHSVDELRKAGADVVVDDLERFHEVVEMLVS